MIMIWKFLKHIDQYILVLFTFESTKNPITIVLSSYFHIFEVGMWHLLSCTCLFLNVLKCILKCEIIKYYAMKSKIFLLLIIKVKNIHEFNVLSLSLWILSTKKKNIPHRHILPCFHPKLNLQKNCKDLVCNIQQCNLNC
jgi:hypothetical protein